MAEEGSRTTPSVPWVVWYANQTSLPGPFSTLEGKALSYFDDVPNSYLSDTSRFVTEVATREGMNFIIVPASGSNVKILHQCFAFSDAPGGEMSVFGIWGARSASPFKKINVRAAVAPMIVPKATRGGKVPHIPSLEHFLTANDAEEFAALEGDETDTSAAILQKDPCSFWIHPFLYRHIKGSAGDRAAELGMKVIHYLRLVEAEDSDQSGSAAEGYFALVFLWAVEKGFTSPVSLGDLPDNSALDEKCHEILRKLLPREDPDDGTRASDSRGAGGTGGGTGGTTTEDLNQSLMLNLTALTKQSLEVTERAEKKKSMKSLLSPEAEELFTLLCARNWRDEKPKTSPFIDKLLADKNMTKALGIIRGATADWTGAVSEKGMVKFLSTGYTAPDIDDRPGGFTIFMFRPLSHRRTRSEKESQSDIRSMFGDGKLSDEMVKYFAKDDFFLPSNLYELQDMLKTCIDGLELLTCRRGIASDGYRYGLEILESNWRTLLNWLGHDKLFPVKFAYLLDKTFQNFVSDLGRFSGRTRPIREARRSDLSGSMQRGIDVALGGFKYGALPNLVLPSALTSTETQRKSEGDEDGKPAAIGATDPTASGNPAWWVTNPNPVKEWGLPKGRQYPNFFNPRDEKLKDNTSGWPSFPHHKLKSSRSLCVKYQCTGKCRAGCQLAHVKPSQIDRKLHDEITVKFQAIYSSGGKT